MKLYELQGRAPRSTPDVAGDQGVGRELGEAEKHRFRSGMGTLLYLSQDRLDTQHAVRRLSQWMSRPTKTAEDGLKRVILYLKGIADYGLMLPYNVKNDSKLDEILQRDGPQHGRHLVEIFTDSTTPFCLISGDLCERAVGYFLVRLPEVNCFKLL